MPRLTIISDDLTGAVDSATLCLLRGCPVRAEVEGSGPVAPPEDGETLSVNLSSRTLQGETAKVLHERIAGTIRDFPGQLVMKKMDTGFRGNAAYEIEGLMCGLNAGVCFVLNHSPIRNTFTLYGNQYVDGIILTSSVFAREDPLKRPVESYIPQILSRDTELPVLPIPIDAVKGGTLAGEVRSAVQDGGRILVFDAVTPEDGRRIVSCLAPLYPDALWAGSLGLADALAQYCYGPVKAVAEENGDRRSASHLPTDNGRRPESGHRPAKRCACFTASAYHSVKRQITEAQKRGLAVIDLDIGQLSTQPVREEAINNFKKTLTSQSVLLRPYFPETILSDPGLRHTEDLPSLILGAVTACAAGIAAASHSFDRLVIIGGETSYSIIHALGCTRLRLTEYTETGIGTGIMEDGLLAGKEFSIKGGSVGSPLALCKMIGLCVSNEERSRTCRQTAINQTAVNQTAVN